MMGEFLSCSLKEAASHVSFSKSIILETDATTIASRVSRPRPDATELQINEQTIMNAYSNLKERVAQRILQGGL